jgi:hypothetical protein
MMRVCMAKRSKRRPMTRRGRAKALLVTGLLCWSTAACDGGRGDEAGSSKHPLQRALISAEDLPGKWSRYRPDETSGGPGICGVTPPATPEPLAEAATAWAGDPIEGPIFGERIELYANGDAARRLSNSWRLPLPCEWFEDGTTWRATFDPAIQLGDDNRVILIENIGDDATYNYDVALRRGDALVRFVLNVRQPDRPLLEELVRRGWDKANTQLGR